MLRRLLTSTAPGSVLLIRLAVGVVFASEGIQKFLYPDALGAGRFARIGIPAAEVTGPFIGAIETSCGLLVLGGLGTRLAAPLLVADMAMALLSTKVPILLGHGHAGFSHTFAPKAGVWSFLHESRTDLSMLCGAMFLALIGAGPWSLDAALCRHIARTERQPPP